MKVIAAILLLCVAKVLTAPSSNPDTDRGSSFNVAKCYADLNVPLKQPIQANLTDDERVCAFACYLQRLNFVNVNATINRNGILNANPNKHTEIEAIVNKCQSLADQNTSTKNSVCVLAGCLYKERFFSVAPTAPTEIISV